MTLITVAVIVALLAGSICAVWRSHEEAKAPTRPGTIEEFKASESER